MKILILDDSLVHRKIIKTSIKHLGDIETDEAESGLTALDKLSGVDLIITDCNMDGMDGLEFTAKVRETDGAIPIIMMSSNNAPEDIQTAINAGVNDYIVKPFNKEDLKEKIEKYLKPKQSDQPAFGVPFEEKRKHIRFPYVLAVKHRVTNTGVYLDSYCSDISLGGLKLLTASAYAPNVEIEMDVHFPEDVREPFNLAGVVRWCLPSDEFNGKFHVGILFNTLDDAQRDAVKQLIETEKEIRKEKDL